MNLFYKLSSLFISILSFLMYRSLALDHYFKDCKPIVCGSITISYPFYILGLQKSYCGQQGFEVTCNSKSHLIINLSNDTYAIQEISYEYQSMNILNTAFIDASFNCTLGIHSFTLDENRFKFACIHSEVFLLQDCNNKVKSSIGEYKEESCISNNKSSGNLIGIYAQGRNLSQFAGKCKKVVSVPYEGRNLTDIDGAIRNGVQLKWNATSCVECAKSGGRCGYHYETSLQMQCFCPHGVYPHKCPKKVQLQLILGLGIGGVVLVFLALLAVWHRKKLKFGHPKYVSRSVSLDRSASDLERGSVYFGIPLFTYTELIEATDNFSESRELGDGGFGIVYYGKLKDGREVAVKRLYEKSFRRVEQFMNEIQILTRLRHQNLVTLYGCTSQHCRELLLVYEYVENGTVADHLFGEKAKPGSLTWPIRLRIAIETASALSYLHASDIIHRDVKTSNILLDSSFKVRVADFGLSRLFPTDVTHVSTAPQGTPGYLDPEYHQCYQLTDRSDVYSFGVVLIELISSLPAIDLERNRSEINLSNYAMNRIQRCAFDELVDPKLGFASDFKVKRMTTLVAELAFQCLQHDKEFRPSMDEILESLNRIESSDYDALQEEEMANDTGEVVKTQSSCPPSSSIDDDHAQLLNTRQLHPPSPISVMDKWDSRSTIQSKDK
ncbi:LEAF RUST 10 DISEASE-RESISTANCE LOCUS RECEPTOR-LIKE PROTEIN KINASE-like 1.2 isoform X2 [Chenopodium quinoa]|uniref:LEAF RUST 10 DISEASE-RESISTANCE LOCUS RECEPTOR-LIKE PROTEIN KINASE-like 1.2 isoform X2 n=1 Tax=Chenopodium quinoa TaxID=63459 RepID=UPI000B79457F|nr:LEAF RUST 10 DISEASE-RESISTANCE LOCUS RECEPTOR-LIKE PROTEIN KINASE-like 1.2 isoform X2 [Chenopodium quinoa]